MKCATLAALLLETPDAEVLVIDGEGYYFGIEKIIVSGSRRMVLMWPDNTCHKDMYDDLYSSDAIEKEG